MIKNIILSGVGGQGILTIASIIDHAAMHKGYHIKQAEVHGMSQRGGAVQSHLRISDEEIFSDLIPMGKADLILSLEPMESLRYLNFLSEEGIIITAVDPVKNISNYPEEQKILDTIKDSKHKSIFIDAKALAKEAGNLKSVNVVLVGAAHPFLGIETSRFESSIKAMFSSKSEEVIASNLKAFNLGHKHVSNII